MTLNWQLAKEIYGVTPWFVDAKSFPMMSSILANIKAGVDMEVPEQKYNAVSYLNFDQETRLISRPYQLDNRDNFDGIGLVNINGPITKSGGMSSYGMDYVSEQMMIMSTDNRIKAFLILCDSGGGSSAAVELMVDTIKSISETKPVYALITKGGMACSAMYGIISGAKKIYSESGMNMVGSIGTMIQFEGRKANSEAPNGEKFIRIYATKSTEKNKDFEEALNNDNYKLMVSELLDPVNENFLNMVSSNRPILKGTDFDNGNVKFAKDSVGTYVDGIKSFSGVIEEIISDYESVPTNKRLKEKSDIKNNSNVKIKNLMTIEQLKNEHPDVFKQVFEAGVTSEKDRVGVWMAHFNTDPDAVKAGIKSGASITGTEREELMVKASAKGNLGKIESDSTKDIVTAESTDKPEDLDEKEAVNFYKDL